MDLPNTVRHAAFIVLTVLLTVTRKVAVLRNTITIVRSYPARSVSVITNTTSTFYSTCIFSFLICLPWELLQLSKLEAMVGQLHFWHSRQSSSFSLPAFWRGICIWR